MFTSSTQIMRGLTLGLALAMGAAAGAADSGLAPRPAVVKPERTMLDPNQHEQHVILVKFHDAIPARLRDGRPTDISGQNGLADAQALLDALAPAPAPGQGSAIWQRMSQLPEETLEEMRAKAQQRLGRTAASMNNYYHLILPPEMDAASIIDAFNALDSVELARPVELPPPSPGESMTEMAPSYQAQQGYHSASPLGVNSEHMWSALGTAGAGIRIVDIEYSFNQNHQDLPDVTILGSQPVSPFGNDHHGTAVLGMLGAIDNGWGITGMAHESDLYFVGTFTAGFVNVAGAILTATANTEPGDIILIEAQTWKAPGSSVLVPVEWNLAEYNAIATAVGNGRIVVAVAGNGSQNLDDPYYSEGNYGHWPFLAENDSGSIIVGAGHAPFAFGGTGVDRARMYYSNYGSRVNMQGWGQAVYTAGYGNAYNAGGADLFYTHNFNGTSSAAPMVAAACALLQSAHKQELGSALSPQEMRDLLMQTGSPQQNGGFPATQNIGPRPNLAAAVDVMLGNGTYEPDTQQPAPMPGDLNGDGKVGVLDMLNLLGAWGACEDISDCAADLNGDGQVNIMDLFILLGHWS